MLSIILGLVGPARTSDGKVTDQTTNEMRAKVRTGLISKAFAGFKECLEGMDPAMAQAIRRQIERAVGLGPRVQEGMLDVLREKFPKLYVKAKVEVWDDETVLYFSEAGLKIKEAEQHEIVNVKMRENAKAIGEAASHGDLSENSEFKFALEERDLLRARVAQLNSELSLARTIDPHDIPTDHVSIGQRLTLIPTAGGAPVEMTLMGINDTDLARRIYSYKTPLARQVLGRRVGDEITISFEDKEAPYRLERIDSAVHYPKLNA
jgi:transcription elongation GreA/GreB family factor